MNGQSLIDVSGHKIIVSVSGPSVDVIWGLFRLLCETLHGLDVVLPLLAGQC
jgi:hypothetical protein